MAIDPGMMRRANEVKAQARRIVDRIRAIPPASGVDYVRTPGQPEAESRRERLAAGFDVPDESWREILECAHSVGLREEDLPAPLAVGV